MGYLTFRVRRRQSESRKRKKGGGYLSDIHGEKRVIKTVSESHKKGCISVLRFEMEEQTILESQS